MSDIVARNQGNVSDEGLINWRNGDGGLTPGDQSIYDTATPQMNSLGNNKVVGDRVFRYAQVGSQTITPGRMSQYSVAAPLTATAANNDPAGGKQITFYFATTVAANYWAEAMVYFCTGTSTQVGMGYRVKSHSNVATTSNGILYLYEPIKYQVVTSDSLALVSNPYANVTINTAGTAASPGLFVVNCTTSDYTWLQIGGPAVILSATSCASGTPLVLSTSGAVTPAINQVTTIATAYPITVQPVGYALANIASGSYGAVFLTIV